MVENVHVGLGDRAYDIIIAERLIEQSGNYISPFLQRPKVAVVTDENVAKQHLKPLEAALNAAGIQVSSLVLPAGETTKSWGYLTQAVEWLLDQKVERRDLVIALGGGVIGDLV